MDNKPMLAEESDQWVLFAPNGLIFRGPVQSILRELVVRLPQPTEATSQSYDWDASRD